MEERQRGREEVGIRNKNRSEIDCGKRMKSRVSESDVVVLFLSQAERLTKSGCTTNDDVGKLSLSHVLSISLLCCSTMRILLFLFYEGPSYFH